jgi:hypothetical protein
MLISLDPTPERLAQLAAWEAAVQQGAEPPVTPPTQTPRPPRTPAQSARERLRRALRGMPDEQTLEVRAGGRAFAVSYTQRGGEGWYEIRDGQHRTLADVEVDLTWPGDRARAVRQVLAIIDGRATSASNAAA